VKTYESCPKFSTLVDLRHYDLVKSKRILNIKDALGAPVIGLFRNLASIFDMSRSHCFKIMLEHFTNNYRKNFLYSV